MDKQEIPTTTRRSRASYESIIGLSILVLLAVIATGIFLRQYDFDEQYFNSTVMQAGLGAEEKEAAPRDKDRLVIEITPPQGYTPMSDQEDFDQITLSDKIDGKADGYLQAGFIRLATRRYVNDSDQNRWFEFYLYDMGTPRNAFSVYSSQKRDGVTPRDFTEFAYSTENALFFACGRLYVEIISAVPEEALIEDLIALSGDFVEGRTTDNTELPELAFLPSEDLDMESISLISKNGFGYDRFDNIITATYHVEGEKIMAFISIRETEEEAKTLSKGYDDTLSEFVGPERIAPASDRIPGLIIADVFGEYELLFTKGNIIAGIHSAGDRGLGEEMALRLYDKISGKVK